MEQSALSEMRLFPIIILYSRHWIKTLAQRGSQHFLCHPSWRASESARLSTRWDSERRIRRKSFLRMLRSPKRTESEEKGKGTKLRCNPSQDQELMSPQALPVLHERRCSMP